jgi:hypothetical protein
MGLYSLILKSVSGSYLLLDFDLYERFLLLGLLDDRLFGESTTNL